MSVTTSSGPSPWSSYEELERQLGRCRELRAADRAALAAWRTPMLNELEMGTVPEDEVLARMGIAELRRLRSERDAALARVEQLEQVLRQLTERLEGARTEIERADSPEPGGATFDSLTMCVHMIRAALKAGEHRG